MTRRSLGRYAILAVLLVFVAWFGVWQIYNVMAPEYGAVWAGVLAGLALLGLGVIALVGVIVIRTREVMERRADDGPDR